MKLVKSNKKLKESKPSDIFDIKVGGDISKLKWNKEKNSKCKFPIFSNGIKEDGLYGFCEEPKIKKESLTISARGTIGACFYRNQPFSPIGRLLSLSSNNANLKYFYYLFQKTKLIGEDGAVKSLTVPMLDKTNLKHVEDINEQKRIADLLDQQQSLIDSYKEKLSILEKQESYYQDELLSGRLRIRLTQESINYVTEQGWYQDNDIVKGKEGEFEAWLEDGFEGKVEFYENKKFEKYILNNKDLIKKPKDWEVIKLQDELIGKLGTTPPKKDEDNFKGDIPWVNISDMNGDLISTEKRLNIKAKGVKNRLLEKGSLLYSFKLTVGAVGFTSIDNMVTNEAIIGFEPSKNKDLNYFSYILKKYLILNCAKNVYGANILNKDLIKNAELLITTNRIERKLIFLMLNKIYLLKLIFKEKIKLEEKKMEYLMDELLSGRIRIEE